MSDKSTAERPGLVAEPDVLDQAIMEHLHCVVGPRQRAEFIYDLGDVSDLGENTWIALHRLFFFTEELQSGAFTIRRSEQNDRYLLEVRQPLIYYPSLLLLCRRRRLRSVDYYDLFGRRRIHHTPARL